MRRSKAESSPKKTSAKVAVLILAVGLGIALLVSGGTFAKWTAAISQMTGATIQIGDWVAVEPPVISTDVDLPTAHVGEAYRYQLEASNSENATWSVNSLYGNLPSGMTLSRDGILSGTPTYGTGVTQNFTAFVRNSAGTDNRKFNLVVHPQPPVFDGSQSQMLPDAFDGKRYDTFTLAASGSPRQFAITEGNLPNGLRLATHGDITGIPVGYGLFTFTVTVSNTGGSDSKEFTINLNSDYPYITTTALPDATLAIYYQQVLAGSGPSPTYSIVGGTLPNGMYLNATSGQIYGSSGTHGLHNFTVSKTNALGTVSQELSIYVRYPAPTITNYEVPTVRKNVPYSLQLAGIGQESTFAISDGRLPDGITLNPATGLISGTTTELGDFNVTFTRTNEGGVATRSYAFQSLLAAPTITTHPSMPRPYVDTYYEMENTGTGEEVVWSASGLVEGLSIDPATGKIFGTPTATVNKYIIVTATNSGGFATASLHLYITHAIPEITTTAILKGEVGTFYSETVKAIGTDVRFAVQSGLPAGLKIDSTTGILSGTPTKGGTYNLIVNATNGGGNMSRTFQLVIESDFPVITTTSLPNAMEGAAYTTYILGTGESSTYALTSGALPRGLSVGTSHQSGYITGTPANVTKGTYTFSITKTNSRGSVSQEFTLNVVHQTPTLTGYAAITQTQLGRNYTFTLAGVGNGATYTLIDGSLPSGITLNKDTGVVSGVSTVTGDFAFTIQKTNESGTVSKDYTFKVVHVAPSMVSKAFDAATIDVPYSMQLKATGLDIYYTIDYGSLPAGMTLDPNTGVISGTSTVAGSHLIRIYANNSGGRSEMLAYLWVNDVPPVISTTELPDGMVGQPYSAKVETVGKDVTYSATGLPNGLKIDTNTGIISGTPTVAQNTTANITVRNVGNAIQKSIKMTIVTQPPTITNESLPDGVVGKSYQQNMNGEGTSTTVTITKGDLPPGIRISNVNGNLSGTPTAYGTYTFTMTKTNISGSVSKEFTINVTYPVPTFTTAAGPLTAAKTGQSYSIAVYGSSESVKYKITEGELPPGLSFDVQPSYLRVFGTPTTPGNYTFTLHKSNLNGEVSRQFSINVTGTPIIASLSKEPSAGLLILRNFRG